MLVATTSLAGFLPLLLILACPLMMIFMMRGMHGAHGHGQAEPKPPAQMDIDELKRARDELNAEIGDRAEQIVHSDTTRYGAFR